MKPGNQQPTPPVLSLHLLESLEQAVVVLQGDRLLYANAACQKITGYNEIQLKNMSFGELIHPEDRERVRRQDFDGRDDDQAAQTFSLRVITRDKKTRHLRYTAKPITWQGHQAILGSAVDLTDELDTEAEHLRAQKLESVGVLAGGIAHDFNNILTVIVGTLSFLKRCKIGDERAERMLAKAEQALARATDLTQQLLTFSKGGTPVRRVFQPQGLIRETTQLMLSGSSVACRYFIQEDLWPINADEGQVGQVLSNLVLNSIQAMPDGGRMEVRSLNRSLKADEVPGLPPGRFIEVQVKDEGEGIPADVLPRIFDPYFTTRTSGSGLGLATTFAIVQKHAGKILVESKSGRGTLCRVFLPASDEQAPDKPTDTRRIQRLGGRVLVMDDQEDVRETITALLDELGFEVAASPDGAAAVEAFWSAHKTDNPFDVVLLDMTVPGGMGAVETLAALRRIDARVKAVVISGYSNEDVLSNHRAHGFIGVLQKPFSLRKLSAELERIL